MLHPPGHFRQHGLSCKRERPQKISVGFFPLGTVFNICTFATRKGAMWAVWAVWLFLFYKKTPAPTAGARPSVSAGNLSQHVTAAAAAATIAGGVACWSASSASVCHHFSTLLIERARADEGAGSTTSARLPT
jgi:hypothetical protein